MPANNGCGRFLPAHVWGVVTRYTPALRMRTCFRPAQLAAIICCALLCCALLCSALPTPGLPFCPLQLRVPTGPPCHSAPPAGASCPLLPPPSARNVPLLLIPSGNGHVTPSFSPHVPICTFLCCGKSDMRLIVQITLLLPAASPTQLARFPHTLSAPARLSARSFRLCRFLSCHQYLTALHDPSMPSPLLTPPHPSSPIIGPCPV